jgi:hypothetical protein
MLQAVCTVLNMGNVEFQEKGAEVFEVKTGDLTGQIAKEIQVRPPAWAPLPAAPQNPSPPPPCVPPP